MKSLLRIAALVAVLTASIHAQNLYSSLTIQHPQNPGKWGMGTIESATVAMTPNGTFMKYDVTMTFSAGGLAVFVPADSVEIQYQFKLPPGAVVNDLWLWVGNELSRGLILDRGTASATYENIVKRLRRDPAYLQKQFVDNYLLQIYPMTGNGSRTVKFSYALPLTKSGELWTAPVPAHLFRSSHVPLQSLRVIYYAPSPAHIPSLVNDTGYTFAPWTDSLSHGNAWKCDIPNGIFTVSDPAVSVPIGKSSPFIVTRYAGSQGGVYHVTLDPFAILGVNTSRKMLFAFDYDSVKTTRTRQEYIDAVKRMLATHCTEKDSFDVLFNPMVWPGERWFAADSAGIASAFSSLGAQTINNFSDIPELLRTAVDILKARGGMGDIILLAASDKLRTPASADPVLAWLRTNLPARTEIHIVNFQDRSYTYEFVDRVYYRNNEYFYNAVRKMTGGSVQEVDNAHPDPLGAAMRSLRGGLNSLDVQVRFANGFSYSKFAYGITPFQSVLTSQLVGQIGKYAGSGSMTLEVAGFYEDEPYQKTIAIPDSAILPADSVMRAVWTGKTFSDIEWTGATSADVRQGIIDACLKERVVCRFTALLALEPGDTLVKTLNDPTTGPVVGGVKEQPVPTVYSIAQAYPNPFNPSTTLRVRLPQGVRAQEVTLKIYNTLGQLVRTFDPTGMTSASHREFRWDGTDDAGRRVASGMYLFVVATPEGRHTVKLMLLK